MWNANWLPHVNILKFHKLWDMTLHGFIDYYLQNNKKLFPKVSNY